MPNTQPRTEQKTAHHLLWTHYMRTGLRLSGEAAARFLEGKACLVEEPHTEQKSAEMALFGHYLRTGERLSGDAAQRFLERKFNPYHDPENGQFTTASRGVDYGGYSAVVAMQQRQDSAKPNAPALSTSTSSRRASTATTSFPAPKGWRKGGDLTVADVEAHADRAMKQFDENIARGMSEDDAAAWAANTQIESGGDHNRAQEGGGPGFGLFQLTYPARKTEFRRVMGVPVERSTREQQLRFRDYELAHTMSSAKTRIDTAKGAGDKAYAIAVHYLAPDKKYMKGAARANLAEAILRKARSRPKPPSQPVPRRTIYLPTVY